MPFSVFSETMSVSGKFLMSTLLLYFWGFPRFLLGVSGRKNKAGDWRNLEMTHSPFSFETA